MEILIRRYKIEDTQAILDIINYNILTLLPCMIIILEL
jgi:hypothetical protein